MGKLRVTQGEKVFEVELVASTVLGRHWNCDIVGTDRQVPNYWLEIRWLGKSWAWRGLTSIDHLRGTGRVLEGGWRELCIGGRIRCGHIMELELIDVDSPMLTLRDLVSGEQVPSKELGEFIDWHDEGAFPLDDDGHSDTPLRDGEVITARGGVFEVRLSVSDASTEMALFHLEYSRARLEIDLAKHQATFCHGPHRIVLEGASALVLGLFAVARVEDEEGGGWLSLTAAFESWIKCGGSAKSEPRRISWEKGKIRTRLSQENVAGVSDLFENQRRGGVASSRLYIEPELIDIL